jgi:hypothetical protein
MRQTINDIQERMTNVSMKIYVCPITANKGAVGHLLEDLLEIPRSSECLDCSDGEVKIVPLKRLKNGKIVPKETIAVTMMEKEFTEFEESRCFKKMRRMLVIPYLRDGDNVIFYTPTLIELNGALFDIIKKDYELIRSSPLQSKIGKYLQTRTKGPGGSVKTRAFYLRTLFTTEFVKW